MVLRFDRTSRRLVLAVASVLLWVPGEAAERRAGAAPPVLLRVDAAGPLTWVRVGPQLKIALPPGVHRVTDAFLVTVRDSDPPEVRLVVPAAGEPVAAGEPLRIEWASDDRVGIAAHAVMVSLDGGPFTTVPGCEALEGTASACTWAEPGPAGAGAVFRVLARDASGNVARDDSDVPSPMEALRPR